MKIMSSVKIGITLIILSFSLFLGAQQALSPAELLSLEFVFGEELSPDGEQIIYSVGTPRSANEAAGGAHIVHYKMNLKQRVPERLFNDTIRASSPRWSPDGQHITFLYSSGEGKRQLWMMHVDSKELKQISHSKTGILNYDISQDGSSYAYSAFPEISERQKELIKRGYDFIYFEEDVRNAELFIAKIEPLKHESPRKIAIDGHVQQFKFSRDGKKMAVSISPKNLVDHEYMFTRIFVLDVASGKGQQVSKNEGKLGNFELSPDGTKLLYAAALDINDSAVSQVFIVNMVTGEFRNLTPDNFKGHVTWASFKNDDVVYYLSGEGVNTNLNEVPVVGGERSIIFNGEKHQMALNRVNPGADGEQFLFGVSKVDDPINLYVWSGNKEIEKITDLNPILSKRRLGKQEVFQFKARDGQEIEGLVIYPLDYDPSEKYPLIMYIHGGPESHHNNAWNSRYHNPGQVMAGKGYLVAYLNYRSSTGYGVDFAKQGLADPAGKEFDDIADAIDYLCSEKGCDANRVGMAGGSYGGYASAWFATYYTEKVNAVCMFVGVSNLISKRGTTDIPYEDMYVHMVKPLEEQWQMNLERSPIYYAHQSKTATLIYGGTDDPRVDPSQSLELYRRMKMNDHPAVRFVQYPGEGHGNRKQVGQIDIINRQIQWFDWYVKEARSLNGEMPPLDISDSYGLDW